MEPVAQGRGFAGQRSYEKLAWGRLLASTVAGYNPYFVGGPPSCQPGDLTIPDTHPLQRADVHEKQGRIYIPRVKGSIAKTSPMQPEDVRLVRAYVRAREDDSPSLFISTRGIPLERRSYWDLMQKYGKQAALPKAKQHFHALRHAIAVHLLDAGADVAFVQDRLGHATMALRN